MGPDHAERVLRRWRLPVTATWRAALLLCLVSTQALSKDFCDGASFVALDNLLQNKTQFLNKRIQTHAILRTDGKEYFRISFEENPSFSILLTADAETTAYFHAHPDIANNHVNVFDDLFSKMQSMGVPKSEREMSKIRFYRQEVTVCGRLVGDQNEVQFAVDDERVERTYLLPWKSSGKR